MTARKFRNSWWVDFRFNGFRYREHSPENSKHGAQAYEALLRHKLARGEPLYLDNLNRKKKFKDFAREWFETYVKTNNKASEIRRKKYTLRNNLIPFFGEIAIDKISTRQVEEYKARQLNKHLKPKTINNQLTVLSSCLRTAQDWYDIPKLPKMKKLKVPPQKFQFLSHEECELILTKVEGIWYEIILTALKTGMRLGELKALQWSDINWSNKTLTVNHSWCEYKKGLISPKSNKERHIPIMQELYEILLKRKHKIGFVFTDEIGKQFNSKQLNRNLANACRKIGIKEVTCHALRHTFASHLVMAGAPLKAIQELLGHASITTTMIYAHLAPSSLRSAVNLLELTPKNYGQPVGNTIKQLPTIPPHFKTQNPELALFKAKNER